MGCSQAEAVFDAHDAPKASSGPGGTLMLEEQMLTGTNLQCRPRYPCMWQHVRFTVTLLVDDVTFCPSSHFRQQAETFKLALRTLLHVL